MTPKKSNRVNNRQGPAHGFSLVELLVTIAIGAGVLAAAVLIYASIASARSSSGSFGTIPIGTDAVENFYGEEGGDVLTYYAPNYGRATRAEVLREQLSEDLKSTSAVFILSRNELNTVRPDTIPIPEGTIVQNIDTPERFREFLAVAIPESADIFESYRGAAPGTNLTLFLLRPSGAATELWLRAIYEIDFVESADPEGTYASVRRYVGDALVDFYDVFYPEGGGGADFLPVAACFERRALATTVEAPAIDAFKKAGNSPFYFVWWPDPAARFLKGSPGASFTASDPRSYYASMGGRTSLFFVIPMFPSL